MTYKRRDGKPPAWRKKAPAAHYSLSTEAIDLLTEIAERNGLSRSNVLEVLIRRYHREQNVFGDQLQKEKPRNDD